MNIEELQHRSYDQAHSKGFWQHREDAHMLLQDFPGEGSLHDAVDAAFIGQKLALIHSEVTEALEEVRSGDYLAHYTDDGKPEGLPSELADVVIRVADLCEALGIDLESTIIDKLDYNSKSRGYKHGRYF